MKTLTAQETPGRVKIAANKAAFDSALFTGHVTFDGFVKRRYKRSISLWALGEDCVLNAENVFCLATKQSDGRTWYSYGGRLNERLSMLERSELAAFIRA